MKRSCFPHRSMARPQPDQITVLGMPWLQMYKCCFIDPFAHTEPAHFRCYKRLVPWFCLEKGEIAHTTSSWIIMFCIQTRDLFQVLLKYAEVWHLLLALKMLLTSVFHLHFLSIKSHNILWATVPKICHTWHKIPFCDGTLYLEMLLFTQTSCRLHLFFT